MSRHAERDPAPRTSGDGEPGISARRFRALLANVADTVTISDRNGKILFASPATEHVSGYTPDEFMQRDPFHAIHPDDRPRCEEAFDRPRCSMQTARSPDGSQHGRAAALKTLVETSTPDGVVAELSLSGEENLVPGDVGTQVYLVMREELT